jgi:hypothetical protein
MRISSNSCSLTTTTSSTPVRILITKHNLLAKVVMNSLHCDTNEIGKFTIGPYSWRER